MKLKLLIVTACLLLLTSCATILKGSMRTVNFTSEPSGATIDVDGVKYTTPATVKLKAKSEYIVRVTKDGYKEGQVKMHTKIVGAFWGNICLGGIIGVIVDMSNGAAYDFEKHSYHIVLESI